MDQQIKGGYHNSSEITCFDSSEECNDFYEKLKIVFYDINSWGKLFENGTNFYRVINEQDIDSSHTLNKKLVKIKVPGLPNSLGDGYDWVKSEGVQFNINIDYTSISFVVSPCCKPGNNFTTHFYTSEAKNQFIIKKYIRHIKAEVHGVNEIPNYKGLSFYNKFRNFFMANGGIFGMSKVHWEIWCRNILDENYITKCLEKD